jgi:PAS domain S-box-containing protein
MERRYTEVSSGFCKILGYGRQELIGKRVDEITAPHTNDIPVIFDLFLKNRYMHGIWIFLNRPGNTKILVRYEARLVSDVHIECTMELIGAGA